MHKIEMVRLVAIHVTVSGQALITNPACLYYIIIKNNRGNFRFLTIKSIVPKCFPEGVLFPQGSKFGKYLLLVFYFARHFLPQSRRLAEKQQQAVAWASSLC